MLTGVITFLMDQKLGLEYREVSLRPEHLNASELSAAEVLKLIDELEKLAEGVRIIRKIRPLSSDPNDDMVLDLAINGKADVIVTANVRHFRAAAKSFAILVATPAQFLNILRKEIQ